MEENSIPVTFIDQVISVFYHQPPLLEKKPACPDAFTWQDLTFQVVRMLAEWTDFQRRGRMARNMQPTHAATASSRGSWGVGRYFFRVETDSGRIFDIYYDRAPKDSSDRKGSWFVLGERAK